MKEATGELSTTVITVVAIAAISTLFIVFLYPQLKSSIILNQACSNGAGYRFVADDGKYAVACKKGTDSTITCYYQDGGNTTIASTSTVDAIAGAAKRSQACNNN